jgi:hypothetical protein
MDPACGSTVAATPSLKARFQDVVALVHIDHPKFTGSVLSCA